MTFRIEDYPPNEETGVWEGDWQKAMTANDGDYAYHNTGGMISQERDGTYTVRSGDIQAASAGNWNDVECTGLAEEDIPTALVTLGMSADGWSYE
jgi:hypothetical protein